MNLTKKQLTRLHRIGKMADERKCPHDGYVLLATGHAFVSLTNRNGRVAHCVIDREGKLLSRESGQKLLRGLNIAQRLT